jgi:hypothetical protein
MLIRPKCNTDRWAEENFRDCDLGDQRRSKRLELFAGQAANRPAASLPNIGEDWGGTKGIYRLLDRPEVTFESVTQTHRKRITQQTGRFVISCDTTHVDFGWQRDLPDAGPIGPGRGQGFLLHSGLLIDAEDRSLVGLAGQVFHIRPKKRKGKQNDSQRLKRWRESEMWIELMEQIGSSPEDSEYIHVCDSAADNFEVFCTAKQLDCDFVIRAGRLHRNVMADGQKMSLSQAIYGLEELGRYDLAMARGNGRKARTAHLRVSARAIQLPVPTHRSSRVKQYVQAGGTSVEAWVVVVEEIDPPCDVEPVKWILLTTVPVDTFEDAWEVVSWYEDRWLVEEWHKALKTGCRLESRQLQSMDRLLPLTGVLSVVAVLLVQLKHAARTRPDQPASELVPTLWLELLQAKRKTKTCEITNYEFWRAVAKLGGFLGRRHDGEPGWQLIWRGWKELHTLAEGAQLAKRCG